MSIASGLRRRPSAKELGLASEGSCRPFVEDPPGLLGNVCGAPADLRAARAGKATASDRGLVEIEYQGCVLSLSGGLARGGKAVAALLVLRTYGRAQGCSAGSEEDFIEMLEDIATNGQDFVVIYDIRGQKKASGRFRELSLVDDVAKLCAFLEQEQRVARILRKAQSMSLLVAGNIFKEATLSLLRSFLDGPNAPNCPFLIGHSDLVADEFFEGLKGAGTPFFVSVVDVQPVTKDACVASLTPLSKVAAPFAEAPSTYHTLPNGDVRVIQSPPRNLVMGQSATGGSSNTEKAAASGADSNSTEIARRCISSKPSFALCRGDLPSVSALLFKGPTESLQSLVGARFHIGELVADADMASRCKGSERIPEPICSAGIFLFMLKLFATISEPVRSDKSFHRYIERDCQVA